MQWLVNTLASLVAGTPAAASVAEPPTTPIPALLYVAFDGVELDACEGSGNSGRSCSELLPSPTVFPAWGSSQQRDGVLIQLADRFAAYDVTIVTERPPAFVPYAMAVVGGTASLLGKTQPSCGSSWIACNGARNSISFAFADACQTWRSNEALANTIAQEVAHNFGLEHVNDASDIMYPTASASVGLAFRDQCSALAGTPACASTHALDCPQESSVRQNGHRELLRKLGARRRDTEPPRIVATTPNMHARLSDPTSIPIWAELADDDPTLAVRWTWLEAPAGTDAIVGWRRCTNDACNAGFTHQAPANAAWPFIEVHKPLPGTYAVLLEAADLHANATQLELRFEVTRNTGDDDGTGEDPSGQADGGCACQTQDTSRTPAIVAWGLLWGGSRRRRRD